MIDLRKQDVDMLLKFEENKPVASYYHQEPEKDRRKYIEHCKNDFNENILALHLHIFS